MGEVYESSASGHRFQYHHKIYLQYLKTVSSKGNPFIPSSFDAALKSVHAQVVQPNMRDNSKNQEIIIAKEYSLFPYTSSTVFLAQQNRTLTRGVFKETMISFSFKQWRYFLRSMFSNDICSFCT